jgi:alpha-L-fucosidase
MLQNGDPAGSVWRPGEADVSIRPGWFNHPAEDARVKTVDALVDLYFSSVGRNAKLLLNVPPTRDGLLHDTDVARLAGMRAAISAIFSENLAAHRRARWQATGNRTATLDVDLGAPAPVAVVDLREDITRGQAVARYTIEGRTDGDWQTLAQGTTIGCRKLDRFPPVTSRQIRVTIVDAVDAPRPIELGVYRGA